MQWNRPLWQRRTHLSEERIRTIWMEVNVEKWIMAKWAQFLPSHILKPVLPAPNWITSFGRRPVFQQLLAGASVSPIFAVLRKLFWSIDCGANICQICGWGGQRRFILPPPPSAEEKNIWITSCFPYSKHRNHFWVMDNKTIKLLMWCNTLYCCHGKVEAWCPRDPDKWHGTEIRLRIMIGLY